nr:MAG TPA: hypothetical protein [Caudoviricetes sp.]
MHQTTRKSTKKHRKTHKYIYKHGNNWAKIGQ